MILKKDTSQSDDTSQQAAPLFDAANLQGQLLIASPHILDSPFQHSVIMMCQHNRSSAMGVVINRQSPGLDIAQIYKSLEMGAPQFHGDQPIYIGGPVEGGRGFVLHSQDHMRPESVSVTHEIGLTSSVNFLRDITNGNGPLHSIISLGYGARHIQHLGLIQPIMQAPQAPLKLEATQQDHH